MQLRLPLHQRSESIDPDCPREVAVTDVDELVDALHGYNEYILLSLLLYDLNEMKAFYGGSETVVPESSESTETRERSIKG